MKYADIRAAYERAQEAVREFEDGRDWPGLSKHDRSYALPVMNSHDSLSVFVRVINLRNGAFVKNACEVNYWPAGVYMGHRVITDWGDLGPEQLGALNDIRKMVDRYVKGDLAELPPSTCKRFAPENKGSRPT